METSDPSTAASNLRNEGERIAERAFKQALGSVEALAKQLAPVGHYGRSRGKPGKSGGDLRASLRTEFLGESGGVLKGRATSALPYAGFQHEELLYHPGLYTGAAGPQYKSKFFEAAAKFIFDVDANSGLYNPGNLPVVEPASFQELLDELSGTG